MGGRWPRGGPAPAPSPSSHRPLWWPRLVVLPSLSPFPPVSLSAARWSHPCPLCPPLFALSGGGGRRVDSVSACQATAGEDRRWGVGGGGRRGGGQHGGPAACPFPGAPGCLLFWRFSCGFLRVFCAFPPAPRVRRGFHKHHGARRWRKAKQHGKKYRRGRRPPSHRGRTHRVARRRPALSGRVTTHASPIIITAAAARHHCRPLHRLRVLGRLRESGGCGGVTVLW